ncbi:MAG: hypothetical protein ACI4PO_05865 [Faecousia sp.]
MEGSEEKIHARRMLAQEDSTYWILMKALCLAEKKLFEVETTMTIAQRDIMWDFFDLSEEVNHRLLEIVFEQSR